MISRDEFLESIRTEVAIVKHLYSKVDKDKLNYKLSPAQRSTSEVLDNLPCNLYLIANSLMKSDFSNFKVEAEAIAASAKKDFNATMDAEYAKFEALVKGLSDSDFKNKEMAFPNGTKFKAGVGLLQSTYRFLVSYKMQLFQYLKAGGRQELVSSNLWWGRDPQPKA